MTDDRTLLEKAAKAAGITLNWSCIEGMRPRRADTWETWNPLESDGDALRLAVKLGITVYRRGEGCYATSSASPEDMQPCRESAISDPYAATRRAVVRAAASLAKE
jgi:hypothetical protein